MELIYIDIDANSEALTNRIAGAFSVRAQFDPVLARGTDDIEVIDNHVCITASHPDRYEYLVRAGIAIAEDYADGPNLFGIKYECLNEEQTIAGDGAIGCTLSEVVITGNEFVVTTPEANVGLILDNLQSPAYRIQTHAKTITIREGY